MATCSRLDRRTVAELSAEVLETSESFLLPYPSSEQLCDTSQAEED